MWSHLNCVIQTANHRRVSYCLPEVVDGKKENQTKTSHSVPVYYASTDRLQSSIFKGRRRRHIVLTPFRENRFFTLYVLASACTKSTTSVFSAVARMECLGCRNRKWHIITHCYLNSLWIKVFGFTFLVIILFHSYWWVLCYHLYSTEHSYLWHLLPLVIIIGGLAVTHVCHTWPRPLLNGHSAVATSPQPSKLREQKSECWRF